MELQELLPGKRIIKTTLAVGICLLISSVFKLSMGFYMVVACVLTMKTTSERSVEYGKSRTGGTMLGGMIGLGVLMLFQHYSVMVSSAAYILLNMLGTVLCIWITKLLKGNDVTATSACVVLFTITISRAAETAVPIPYVIDRVVETLVGIFIAVLVNLALGEELRKPI